MPPYPRAKIDELLSFQHPGRFFMPSYKIGAWDGWINYLKRDTLPSGTFLEYWDELAEIGCRFDITDHRRYPAFREVDDQHYLAVMARLAAYGKEVRDYQDACVDAMIANSGTGGIILAATGSGKTLTAAVFFARLVGQGVFIVDELSLLDQARKAFSNILGEEIGIVGNSKFEPRRITVATVQTLGRHRKRDYFLKWMKGQDVFIIDEVHVQMARRNFDVVEKAQPMAVYGLTATLQHQNKDIRLKASALCGPLIFDYSLAQGTEEGHLTPGMVCAVLYANKGLSRSTIAPEVEYDCRIVRNKARNDIVEGLVRQAIQAGLPTVVLVERIIHLRMLSIRLEDIPHEDIWGEKSRYVRNRAKEDFDAGRIDLLLCSRVFAKGQDIEKIAVIIDATATKSANSAGQKFGRGTRLSVTKRGLLYFDVCDITPAGEHRTRLHDDSQGRWRAYGALKIPRIRIRWKCNPEAIFRQAQAELEKVVTSRGTKLL